MNTDPRPASRKSRSLAWPATACLAVIALAGAAFTRPAAVAAQVPAAPAATTSGGRYQVVAVPRELNPYLVLVDTQTGQVWTANAGGGSWEDRGTPPAKK
jgi:hypothetical protein